MDDPPNGSHRMFVACVLMSDQWMLPVSFWSTLCWTVCTFPSCLGRVLIARFRRISIQHLQRCYDCGLGRLNNTSIPGLDDRPPRATDWNVPQPAASALEDHGEAQYVEEVEEEQTPVSFSGARSMQPAEVAAPVETSPPEETTGFGFATAAAVQQDPPAEEPSGFAFGPNAGAPAFGGLFEGSDAPSPHSNHGTSNSIPGLPQNDHKDKSYHHGAHGHRHGHAPGHHGGHHGATAAVPADDATGTTYGF